MRRILTIVLLVIVFILVMTIPFYIWGVERFVAFSDQEKIISSIILPTLELIGIFVSVVIVVTILYQYFRYRRPYRLVFEAFSNESELIDTEKKPLNLSILAQEELERQFRIIYNELNGYADRKKKSQSFEALVADELYIEEEALGNKIGNYVSVDQIKKSGLIEDLKDVIKFLKDPKGMNLISLVGEIAPKEAAPVMKFIEAVIPPHVIKATGYLQWRSSKADKDEIPDNVGMTFKYEDLSNQRNLMVRTIWWQTSEKSATATHTQTTFTSRAANNTLTYKVAEQYIELLSPAMHWTALIFWEQKLMSHVPPINHILKNRERRRQARILYLLGSLYYAHAEQYHANNTFFCQLAVEHFRQASIKDSSWSLPYLYLANLYSFKSFEVQKTENERSELLFNEARSLYRQALDHTNKTNVHTRLRIIIARALAELASGILTRHIDSNTELVEAIQEVEKIKKQIDPADFDPQRADCAAYLYNLAIYYGMAYDHLVNISNVVSTRDEARRYLAYSLVRSRSVRDMSEQVLDEKPGGKPKNDENIVKRMRDEGDLKILLEIIKKELDEKPKLTELTGEDFKSEIDKILGMVDQRLGRGGS